MALRASTPRRIAAACARTSARRLPSSFGQRLQTAAWLPHTPLHEPARVVLLCASQVGYQNLCQLITRFKMREATKDRRRGHAR